MNIRKHMPKTYLLIVAVVLLTSSPTAFAYLDPSTGSMVVSAIVGIFASVALAVKTYWYRIKALLGRDKKDNTSTRDHSE
ncbi:MAG: hypothetical protein KJO70_05520 [Gammaproteobacteria bacterium]|nr:hypothetical protein [Gammaproteobacteria bacterium]NNJ78133.1 hypothetical protein [Xanthomonadales bacterium]